MDLPTNTDDESQTSLSRNVVVTTVLGLPLQPNLIAFLCSVLLDVRLGALEELLPLLVVGGALLHIQWNKYRYNILFFTDYSSSTIHSSDSEHGHEIHLSLRDISNILVLLKLYSNNITC